MLTLPRASIALFRHGTTAPNLAGAFLSAQDPPLDATGRAECERVREALGDARFDVAFASPMRRCRESLAILAPGLPYEVIDALREIAFGDWDGRTREWLERHDPEGLARRARDPIRFRPNGGESFEDVARRIRPFARELRERSERVLVVGHRGTLGVLERLLRGLPLESQLVKPLEPSELRVLAMPRSNAPVRLRR